MRVLFFSLPAGEPAADEPGFLGDASSSGTFADAWYARKPTAATASAVSPATNPELLLDTLIHLSYVRLRGDVSSSRGSG